MKRTVPSIVAGDHTPLALNNGEAFGLEDLGYWARLATEVDEDLDVGEEILGVTKVCPSHLTANDVADEVDPVTGEPWYRDSGTGFGVYTFGPADCRRVEEKGTLETSAEDMLQVLEGVEGKDRKQLWCSIQLLISALPLKRKWFIK